MSPREIEQVLDLVEDMTATIAELLAMVRRDMQGTEAAAPRGARLHVVQ